MIKMVTLGKKLTSYGLLNRQFYIFRKFFNKISVSDNSDYLWCHTLELIVFLDGLSLSLDMILSEMLKK
jgi:hypothetical protein